MGQQATLINEAGKKVVVESGSQEAQDFFGKGYQLMGASGTYQAPAPTPTATPAPTEQKATLIGPNGERKAVVVGSAESKDLMSSGWGLEGKTQGQLAVTPTDTTRSREVMEQAGWNYISTLSQKDEMIRAGKEVTLEKGRYFWKEKQTEGPTQETGDIRDRINDAVNRTQDEGDKRPASDIFQDILNKLQSGEISDVAEMFGGERPEAPDLLATYEELRDKHKVEDMENSLNTLDDQLDNIDDSYQLGVQEIEGKLGPMQVLGGEQRELQKQYQEERRIIQRQRDSIGRRLEMKYNTINMMMQFTQQDFENSRATYNDKFAQAMSTLNFFSAESEREFQRGVTLRSEERANISLELQEKQDARANINVILDQITAGGIDMKTISPEMRAQITALEAKAGYPAGFTSTIIAENAGMEILSTTARTDATGTKYSDVIMKAKDGTITVKSYKLGQEYIGGIHGSVLDDVKTGVEKEAEEESENRTSFREDLIDLDNLGYGGKTVATKGEEKPSHWMDIPPFTDQSGDYVSREQVLAKLQSRWGWYFDPEEINFELYQTYPN